MIYATNEDRRGWIFMNVFMSVLQLAMGLRGIFEAAMVMSALFGVVASLIVSDIYAVYSQLLPFEELWPTLTLFDQFRLVLMPIMLALSGWYGLGAYHSYSNRYVFR